MARVSTVLLHVLLELYLSLISQIFLISGGNREASSSNKSSNKLINRPSSSDVEHTLPLVSDMSGPSLNPASLLVTCSWSTIYFTWIPELVTFDQGVRCLWSTFSPLIFLTKLWWNMYHHSLTKIGWVQPDLVGTLHCLLKIKHNSQPHMLWKRSKYSHLHHPQTLQFFVCFSKDTQN